MTHLPTHAQTHTGPWASKDSEWRALYHTFSSLNWYVTDSVQKTQRQELRGLHMHSATPHMAIWWFSLQLVKTRIVVQLHCSVSVIKGSVFNLETRPKQEMSIVVNGSKIIRWSTVIFIKINTSAQSSRTYEIPESLCKVLFLYSCEISSFSVINVIIIVIIRFRFFKICQLVYCMGDI